MWSCIPTARSPQPGLGVLMGCVAAVSFAAGLLFFLAGAWPVVGFLGLDVLLIYGAFKLSYRSARLMETIALTEEELLGAAHQSSWPGPHLDVPTFLGTCRVGRRRRAR